MKTSNFHVKLFTSYTMYFFALFTGDSLSIFVLECVLHSVILGTYHHVFIITFYASFITVIRVIKSSHLDYKEVYHWHENSYLLQCHYVQSVEGLQPFGKKVGKHLPGYTVSHYSSYFNPREPQTSNLIYNLHLHPEHIYIIN